MKTLRILILFVLLAAGLGVSTSGALASSASAIGDGLHPVKLAVANGRVTFDTCRGTCSAADIDPASAGPVRPWQMRGPAINATMLTFNLTGKGMRTALTDGKGNAQTYTGLPCTICFSFTSAEAAAAGGQDRLRVAYWASDLNNCDDDWAFTCTKVVKGNWHVLKTTYVGSEACALLRLTGSFALVQVTGP